jgi:hypothetical protein
MIISRGADKPLDFPISPTSILTILVISKFTVFYMSDLNSIKVKKKSKAIPVTGLGGL